MKIFKRDKMKAFEVPISCRKYFGNRGQKTWHDVTSLERFRSHDLNVSPSISGFLSPDQVLTSNEHYHHQILQCLASESSHRSRESPSTPRHDAQIGTAPSMRILACLSSLFMDRLTTGRRRLCFRNNCSWLTELMKAARYLDAHFPKAAK